MAVTALTMAHLRNLFGVVMLSGVFSLQAAALYVALDAVDVAFTEAAVGAGISTLLMLSALAITSSMEKSRKGVSKGPLALAVLTGVLLIYATFDMPVYGDPNAPIHQHVALHYIKNSGQEIGIPNIVTSVLASYRGYDTLGEVTVIFTAAAGVLAVIGRNRRSRGKDKKNGEKSMKFKSVLRVTSKLLIPPILLFALYVQFHGDYGPGGGFQAGVIFASAMILYALIFGVGNARQAIPAWVTRSGIALGVLLYAGVGIASMLMGGSFLNYSVLASEPTLGQLIGINLIELGVGVTVASAMVTIYYNFAAKAPEEWTPEEEEESEGDL